MKHYFDLALSSSTTHHDTQTRSDNGDDVSTVDSAGVVTVKAANVKGAKMVRYQGFTQFYENFSDIHRSHTLLH